MEAYDLLKAIYQERGYRQRDVAQLILEKNLFGLEICPRAAQLTSFALMMKGRADDRRLFERGVKLNVMALVDSAGFDAEGLAKGVQVGDYGLKPGDLTELKRLFEHATTFGSLIQVPEGLAKKLPALKQLSEAESEDLFLSDALKRLGTLVQQVELLAAQYDAVVENPPYMGGRAMNSELKKFAKDYFPNAKGDLFACFIERGFTLAKHAGFNSMITMQSWMFLSSYEEMRKRVLQERTIRTMAHLGARAFGSISGEVVQTTMFVVRNLVPHGYKPAFFRLLDGGEEQKRTALGNGEKRFDTTAQDEFKKIPGSPVAYWVGAGISSVFASELRIGDTEKARLGIRTGDNDRFLRLWFEISDLDMKTGCQSASSARASGMKWFPYNKGGEFRKWFGNLTSVVNWENDGYEIKQDTLKKYPALTWDNLGWKISNEEKYFLPGITWTDVTSATTSARYLPEGCLYDCAGHSAFPGDETRRLALLGYINTPFANQVSRILNPTLHFQGGDFNNLPYPNRYIGEGSRSVVSQMVSSAKKDWDAYERSWDFQSLPILTASTEPPLTLESSYTTYHPEPRHHRRDEAPRRGEQPPLHRRLWSGGRAHPRRPHRADHPHGELRLPLRRQAHRRGAVGPLQAGHHGGAGLLCDRLHDGPLQPGRRDLKDVPGLK